MDDFFNLRVVKEWAEEFCAEIGYPIEEPIAMKNQMESPGWLRLSTKSLIGLLAFGGLMVGIAGGGVKWSQEEGLNMHTNGILNSISDFLDRKAERELLEPIKKSLDSLKIDSLKDIEPYLELLRIRNEGRTE